MAYGWTGEHTRLVPLDRERHFDNAVAWLNDPEVTAGTMIGDMPITRLAEEAFFEYAMKGTDRDVVFALETLDHVHIGLSGLHEIDWKNRVATTGSIIGRTDLWGKGHGADGARVRSRYAFDVLGLRMLLSTALEHNVRSQRMLLAVGYTQVGRIPGRFWKRGAWRDSLLYVLDRETWAASDGAADAPGKEPS